MYCKGTVTVMKLFKKIAAFLLSLLLFPVLIGCQKTEDFSLSDLKKELSNQKILLKTEAGTYTLLFTFTKENSGTLTFLTPENLEGICFEVEDEHCTVKTGSLALPVEYSSLPDKGLLLKVFSLPENSPLLKSSKHTEEKDYTVYTCVADSINYLFYLDDNGRLCRLECEGTFPFSAEFLYD